MKTWQTILLAIIAWLVKKWLKPDQLDALAEIRRKEIEADGITTDLVAEMARNPIDLTRVDELDARRLLLDREIAALRRQLKSESGWS